MILLAISDEGWRQRNFILVATLSGLRERLGLRLTSLFLVFVCVLEARANEQARDKATGRASTGIDKKSRAKFRRAPNKQQAVDDELLLVSLLAVSSR